MYSKSRKFILPVAACGIATICILAVVVGASQSHLTWAAPTAPNDVVVAIYEFYFDPPELVVSPGTTVVWQNWGEMTHTVSITGVVSSGDIAPYDNFSHTFNLLGTFPYQSSLYPEMQGVIRVVNADEVPIDLAVSAWKDQTVGAGADIDYHVSYYNYDWSFGTQNVVLTVTLPTASLLVTSTRDGAYFPPNSQSGQTFVYNMGALAANDSGVIDLVVHLPNNLVVNDIVLLTARISGTNPDPYPDNNYAQDEEMIPGANMVIYKRRAYDSGLFAPGYVVTYTIDYYNAASYIDATSVVVTDHLPISVTFLSALKDDWIDITPITPTISGSDLVFSLGTLAPGDSGQLQVQAQLDSRLFAKTVLRNTVQVATSAAETTYEDNWAFDEQDVLPTQPDLWVELHSSTDGQMDGYQSYWANLGNAGPLDAHNVTLTLSIPNQLTDLDIYPAPDIPLVTRTNDYLATWFIGTILADDWGNGVSVSGIINAAGQITATASLASTSDEADPADNVASVSDYNAEILMPIIEAPNTAIVGTRPVFFGLGQPDATVTLYLSGTVAVPGRMLGSDVVDGYGRWMITPTTPINQPGWYWFTATQQMNNRISPVTGVGNFVTDTLVMDTNSMVRYYGTRENGEWPEGIEGERIGGINQPLGWRRATTYTLGVQLTRCAPNEPISPTLQALLFNDDGLMVGYRDMAAAFVETTTGYVEFEFWTPEEESFELFLRYYCPVTAMLANSPQPAPLQPSGWWQDLKDWFGCWESLGCDKPDPPPPPKPGCPGCTPIPRPRPRPKPTDPDGFVYDCSQVRAGASIAQSIIQNAWVTATQRTDAGVFGAWNAQDYDQVNPQFTDARYPDKVQKPGYYSFLVPSGDYRIQVVAPGYVPFESQVLHVTSFPVTLNVPMKRPGDVGECTIAGYRVFLPIVIR
jgi:uncharacterized repeat protein (TIGR01451 family)